MTDKAGLPTRATARQVPPLKGEVDALSTERVFRALANGSRREILSILEAQHGPMTSGEIAGHFDSSWQTMSRHLKVLEEAGLISFERQGRDRAYKIEPARLQAVAGHWLMRFAAAPPSPAEAGKSKE